MTALKNDFYESANLDTIASHILDSLHDPMLPVLKESEKSIEKGISGYTEHITSQLLGSNGCNTTSLIEDHVSGLLDSICESNQIYFQTGMKMGAVLLKQLLDL